MVRIALTRWLLLVALVPLLAACGGRGLVWGDQPQAPVRKAGANADRYTVRPGDTLYSIAFRFGIEQRDLVAWNRLSDATLIYPGQVLRLSAPRGGARPATNPSTSAARPAPTTPVSQWQWPTDGPVVTSFDPTAKVARTGVLISGRRGQSVVAAAAGEIVYSGSGIKGYGKLIIVRHNADYLSAYGHNAALLVAEGDRVRRGQKIATMGEAAGQRPRLHFEIRLRGEPINPLPLLPKR